MSLSGGVSELAERLAQEFNAVRAEEAARGRGPSGWVDVRSAGAVGNGIADDTAAIQAAIDGSAAGDTIWFPGGVYKVSACIRLKPSRCYLGAGGRANLTTIKAASGITGGAVVAADGWFYSKGFCDTQIRIEGIQVDGSAISGVHGLVIFNYWARVIDVSVLYINGAAAAGILCTDRGRDGVTITASSHSENQFDMCRFDTFTNGATAFQVDSFNGYANMDGDLRNSRFAQIGGYGTHITRSAGWALVNNHYYGIGYDAIRAERCYATRVTDNYVEGFGDQNLAAPGSPTNGYYQGIMMSELLNGRASICSNNTVSTTQPSSPAGLRFTCYYLEAGASQTRAKIVFEGNAATFYNDTAPAVPRSWAVDMDVKSGGLLEVQYGDNLIEGVTWWQSVRSASASVTVRDVPLVLGTPKAVTATTSVTPDAAAGSLQNFSVTTSTLAVAVPSGPGDRQVLRLAFKRSTAASTTITLNSSIRLSTGLTSRSFALASGEVLLCALEYTTMAGAWALTAATVVAAS